MERYPKNCPYRDWLADHGYHGQLTQTCPQRSYSGTSINERPRDWQNLFVISRFRYIGVLLHIFYYYWCRENRSLYRGSLYRGSIVFKSEKPVCSVLEKKTRSHVTMALPSGLRFEVHVCTASPRSRDK